MANDLISIPSWSQVYAKIIALLERCLSRSLLLYIDYYESKIFTEKVYIVLYQI